MVLTHEEQHGGCEETNSLAHGHPAAEGSGGVSCIDVTWQLLNTTTCLWVSFNYRDFSVFYLYVNTEFSALLIP